MSTQEQKPQIIRHLLAGHPLTPIQALNSFGCLRLASVIHKLRSKHGFTMIQSRPAPASDKRKKYAQYFISPGPDLLKARVLANIQDL